jgi:hypothetical protein
VLIENPAAFDIASSQLQARRLVSLVFIDARLLQLRATWYGVLSCVPSDDVAKKTRSAPEIAIRPSGHQRSQMTSNLFMKENIDMR